MSVSGDGDRNRRLRVSVYLHPDLHVRLDEIAQRRGFPVATLVAVVLGEYVERVALDLQLRKMVELEVARRRLRLGGLEGGDDPCSTSVKEGMTTSKHHIDPQ